MNEKFEYQGYWWLPGADEDGVPGILKFDPDGGGTRLGVEAGEVSEPPTQLLLEPQPHRLCPSA